MTTSTITWRSSVAFALASASLSLAACSGVSTSSEPTPSVTPTTSSQSTPSTSSETTTSSSTSTTEPGPTIGDSCDSEGAALTVIECRQTASGLVWLSTSLEGVRQDRGGSDDACRLPDQRTEPLSSEIGSVIGFPLSLSGALTPSIGEVTLAAVAVDFPDFPGVESELARLRESADDFDDWIDTQSGGRVSTSWQFHEEWITLSRPAADYNVQGFGVDPYQEVSTEIVDRVLEVMTLNNLDELFVYFPDSLTASEFGLPLDPFDGILAQIGIPKREVNEFGSQRIRNMKGSGTISKRNGNVLWAIWAHEFLHAMGLQAHGPEPSTLIDSVANGLTTVSAWNRWLLGWMAAEQMVCLDSSTNSADVDLIPLEADPSIPGPRAAMLPLSETSAILVEAHRSTGSGSALGPPGTYGLLVYLIDSSEVAPCDPFTNDESAGTRFIYPAGVLDETRGPYGAAAQEMMPLQPLMFLGEHAEFADVTVEFVGSSGFDTVRISRSGQ